MQITPITHPAEFDQVKKEWQDLCNERQAPNPFLSWEFMSLWWRHFGQPFGHKLHVLAGFDRGSLVGVAPCYLRRDTHHETGPRTLCFLGDNVISPDFLDFTISTGFASRFMIAAADFLRRHCHHTRIELNGVSVDDFHGSSWKEFLLRLNLDVEFFGCCPWIKLPIDVTAFHQSLSPRWRHSLKRKRRRLQKNCPYRFEAYSGGEAADHLGRFIALNRQRLRNRGLDGGFGNLGFRAFHIDLAETIATSGMIELQFLKSVSGGDIAGIYLLKDPGSRRYFFYQQGFREEYGIYSPGNVLTAEAIEFAIDNSVDEFHFLRGGEPYKYRWTKESKTLISLVGSCK